MSQGGYDQFFEKAADNARGARPRSARRARAGSRPFPATVVGGMLFCMGVGATYLANPEWVERWVDRIEIRAFGQARAGESEKPAEAAAPGKKPAAKDAAPDPKPDSPAAAAADGEKGEKGGEPNHFDKLRQRKEELDAREKELGELEEELQKQKVELDRRIQTLEDLRASVAQILKDRVEMDQEKVTKLVDLYANMKPKQAADIIGALNEELAVEVLAKMKKKNAAEVMNLLPAEKARVLSEKYTGYRRRAGAATEKN